MIRFVATAALIAAAVPAQAAERNFLMTGFDSVGSAVAYDVIVTTGKGYGVKAVGPQDKLDRLKIDVSGSRLRIDRERGWFQWSDKDPVKIYVSLPVMKAASVAGSGNMSVDRVKGDAFRAGVAGSGNLAVASVDVREFKLSVAGSGDATAAGKCTASDVSVAGSGNADLSALKCETMEIGIAGSGNVRAFVTKAVTGGTAGSGDLTVTGGARCSVRAAGSSSIDCD
jgi:Putative auto-transporter adhesin, head GIN domain